MLDRLGDLSALDPEIARRLPPHLIRHLERKRSDALTAMPSWAWTWSRPIVFAVPFAMILILYKVYPESPALNSNFMIPVLSMLFLLQMYTTFRPGRTDVRAKVIVALGKTGAGKSTLLDRMMGLAPSGPRGSRRSLGSAPTSDVEVYTLRHETRVGLHRRVTFVDFVDYEGSNLGGLVRQWGRLRSFRDGGIANMLPRLLVRGTLIGHPTCVILIIDCGSPSDDGRLTWSRVAEHIASEREEWGRQALQLIGSVLLSRPPHLILFLNKVDLVGDDQWLQVNGGLMRRPTSSGWDAVETQLLALADAMQYAMGGSDVDIVLGSALDPMGTGDILESINDAFD